MSAATSDSIRRGQFVIGSFFASDNSCVICQHRYQTSCLHRDFIVGAQAPLLRVPLADGTLVPTRERPPRELIPSLLSLSDVMGTGWFAADAANVKRGSKVVVVGDVPSVCWECSRPKQKGAEQIIALSSHTTRQKLARDFGATDIVAERGEAVSRG